MHKTKRTSIILLFLVSLASTTLRAQSHLEVGKFIEATTKVEKRSYESARENKNELSVLFSGLFLFYKNFISSQDLESCVFTPSCSEYALITIKQQGLIKGVPNIFDRLSRCNPLSAEKYMRSPDLVHLQDSLVIN